MEIGRDNNMRFSEHVEQSGFEIWLLINASYMQHDNKVSNGGIGSSCKVPAQHKFDIMNTVTLTEQYTYVHCILKC